MSRPAYRLIDHTADMAFEVEGADWPELLRNATVAVGDVLLAASDEDLDATWTVEVSGADREDVLVAWLNEVALLFEDEGFLAREASFEMIDDTEARGILRGRVVDFDREPPDRVIKAVTYHDLAVTPGEAGNPWRATIVLDL